MEPYSAVLGTAIGAIGQVATPAPAGPSQASSGDVGGNAFDNSGFNVTFGNDSGITTQRSQDNPMGKYLPYVLIAVAGLVAWRLAKR